MPDFTQLLPILTGSGGALAFAIWWIYSLKVDKKVLESKIDAREEELHEISRKSIECITLLLAKEEENKDWRDKVMTIIHDMKERQVEVKAMIEQLKSQAD